MRPSRLVILLAVPAIAVFAATRGPDASVQDAAAPPCRPIDSAWALSVRAIDAATRRPVANLRVWTELDGTETDSLGWTCLRDFSPGTATLSFSRPGYRDQELTIGGATGEVVRRDILLRRVARPCCDLRGRWKVVLELRSPSEFHPNPKGRSIVGEVHLGPRIAPAEEGDELDSLVRVVRGLHHLDFTPFFDGPVARDVSTSVFGSGPDLLREVMAIVPQGNAVAITFIPRMSHGSLSLDGRIRADTIRGTWVQNAYSAGARGRFVMSRIGPVDTTRPPRDASAPVATAFRSRRWAMPPERIAAGDIPRSGWRPALSVAPDGRLWLASGGLFVADSFGAEWRRVLGGPVDPVDKDELRTGVELAFFSAEGALVGLPSRYPVRNAPVLYRTTDLGASWAAVRLPDVTDVRALEGIGTSVWLVGRRSNGDPALARSDDGGATWNETVLPARLRHPGILHRASATAAYLANTDVDDGRPALWHTTDGGLTWTAVSTPHDQGVQHVGPGRTRIEEIATIDTLLLVREHGKVFVTSARTIGWRLLPGLDHIASEPGSDFLFVLSDSLDASLFDAGLRQVWRGTRPLAPRERTDVEQVTWRRNAGYVSMGRGSLHEVRDGRIRTLAPPPR